MLTRSINQLQATALVVGIIIGASIFVQPSVITGSLPSTWAVYAVWAVAGVLTLCGALIAAELTSAFPKSGGVYVFLKEAYSPSVAFLWGWAMFWTMHTGIIAAISMIFARYFSFFVPGDELQTKLLAIAAVLLLSCINYLGVKAGSVVQTLLTFAKVGAIVFITGAAFVVGRHTAVSTSPVPAVPFEPITVRAFALALVAGLFAFGGWHMVTYSAEETEDPEQTIPKALITGTIIVTVCYILLNAAYFHVLTPNAIAASTRVAADAADAIFGHGGAAFMSAVVAVSTFGALNGVILAGPRVYLQMARDGVLFGWAGEIHESYRTPARAIMLQAVWASVLVATGTYTGLFARVVFTEWLFFALLALGLLRMRKRRRVTYKPKYKVPGYPVVPIVFAASSLFICANQFLAKPEDSVIGLLTVLVGFPVYLIARASAPEAQVTPEPASPPPAKGPPEPRSPSSRPSNVGRRP